MHHPQSRLCSFATPADTREPTISQPALNEPASNSPAPDGRFGGTALLGLLAILVSPFAYVALVDQPFLRSTNLPLYALLAFGAVLALFAIIRDRRRWVRGVGITSLVLAGLLVPAWGALTALPARSSTLESAPDFELPDHTGQTVTLAELRRSGPLLLVFYRGHW